MDAQAWRVVHFVQPGDRHSGVTGSIFRLFRPAVRPIGARAAYPQMNDPAQYRHVDPRSIVAASD